MYLFAFDIGNTSITSGIFYRNKLVKTWRMPSCSKLKASDYTRMIKKHAGRIKPRDISGTAVSSVVPSLNATFTRVSEIISGKKPLFAGHANCGIRTHYRNPAQIGSDRLVNAVAGYKLFGGPLVIADFGTALTFDCVDPYGSYLGGLIFPGIGTSARALQEFTAKLPLVEISGPAKHIIGKTTEESIKSGIYFGYTGLVKYICGLLKKQLKCDKIISTGGNAGIISKKLRIKTVPELTLLGLKFIWDKNIQKDRG